MKHHQIPRLEEDSKTAITNARVVSGPSVHHRFLRQVCVLTSRTGKKRALQSRTQQNSQHQKWVVYVEGSNVPKSTIEIEKAPTHQVPQTPILQSEERICHQNHRNIPSNGLVTKAQTQAPHMIQPPIPAPHPTFCIPQYNLLRAIFINANFMGLTLDLLNEDLASQFNLVGPSTLHLPASLHPSQKQRRIIHHPWIDLIPMLSLREALLDRVEVLDEDELCDDLYGACGSSGEAGLRIWGEAWDPSAYEASEKVIRKWGWMVKECPDIIESSNYWRRQRGEKAIVFKS